MADRFSQTISGGSQNTGRAVVRIGAGATAAERVSLGLPENWTADDEGRKLLNERLRQIEYELGRAKDYEVSVPVKYAYATVTAGAEYAILVPEAAVTDITPVPGAKLSLDKIGTWLLLMSVTIDVQDATVLFTADLVVDAGTEAEAKIQPARIKVTPAAGFNTYTSWCLFTATSIPRLVSLYVTKASGAGASEIQEPTHIAAVWLGRWTASTKRFGRQTPTATLSILDANGDALTIHGEEARWPASDSPDELPVPATMDTLYDP